MPGVTSFIKGNPVNVANSITLLRLLLVPVFAVLIMSYTHDQTEIRHWALAVYIAAAISDALDGFVARAYNQKTKLGAVLDPLADKLIINIGFIFMAANQNFSDQIPYWFPVVILSRDALIVLGAYLINEYYGPLRVRPRVTGKLTTVFQMGLIIAVLLGVSFAHKLMIATLIVSVISFIHYMYDGIRQIGREEEH